MKRGKGTSVGPVGSRNLGVGPFGKKCAYKARSRPLGKTGKTAWDIFPTRKFAAVRDRQKREREREGRPIGRGMNGQGTAAMARREGRAGESRRNGTGLSEIYVKARVSRKLIVDSSYVCGRFVSSRGRFSTIATRRRDASLLREKNSNTNDLFIRARARDRQRRKKRERARDFSRNRPRARVPRVISLYRDPRYVSYTRCRSTDTRREFHPSRD